MKIYYLSFDLTPEGTNPELEHVKHGYAYCWVKASDASSASVSAEYYISKYGWKIVREKDEPVPVELENFQGRDLGKQNFLKAEKEGISITFQGIAKDGLKMSSTPSEQKLSSPESIDLSSWIRGAKERAENGRCLHFESGKRCDQFINAHSIQNNGALSKISRDGEVYVISSNYGAINKSGGILSFQKRGVRKVSTFRGFCKKHDNELFAPIDDSPLELKNHQQVFLYAYRCLCREIFVKTNAAEGYGSKLKGFVGSEASKNLIEYLKIGSEIGLDHLKAHKDIFDESLKNNRYDDIEYVVLCSKTRPNVVFSGGIYPEFNFQGEQVQKVSRTDRLLDYMAFAFAPIDDGWAFVMAWHKSSRFSCWNFIESLKLKFREEGSLADPLFRFLMTYCENLAISPDWFESLTRDQISQLEIAATSGVSLQCGLSEKCLVSGMEGMCGWEFDSVEDGRRED